MTTTQTCTSFWVHFSQHLQTAEHDAAITPDQHRTRINTPETLLINLDRYIIVHTKWQYPMVTYMFSRLRYIIRNIVHCNAQLQDYLLLKMRSIKQHWLHIGWLTFAERNRWVFSLSGFANMSTIIVNQWEFRLSRFFCWAKTISDSAQRKLVNHCVTQKCCTQWKRLVSRLGLSLSKQQSIHWAVISTSLEICINWHSAACLNH